MRFPKEISTEYLSMIPINACGGIIIFGFATTCSYERWPFAHHFAWSSCWSKHTENLIGKLCHCRSCYFSCDPFLPRSIFNRYLVDNEDYCTLSYVNISGRLKIFPRNFNTSPIFHLNGSTNAGHNKLCTCPPPVTPPLTFTLHPHPSRLTLQQRRPRTVSDHLTQQASFLSPSFAVSYLE